MDLQHHSGADPVPREMGSPGERLRRCVRLVIVCVRLCQQSQKRLARRNYLIVDVKRQCYGSVAKEFESKQNRIWFSTRV